LNLKSCIGREYFRSRYSGKLFFAMKFITSMPEDFVW
jgi:hypothetical protein